MSMITLALKKWIWTWTKWSD